MTEKRVWLFEEGDASMRNLLGGKGANLAEMTNLGLPVPPGLTITTETCMDYINHGNKMPYGVMDEVKAALKKVEENYKLLWNMWKKYGRMGEKRKVVFKMLLNVQ